MLACLSALKVSSLSFQIFHTSQQQQQQLIDEYSMLFNNQLSIDFWGFTTAPHWNAFATW